MRARVFKFLIHLESGQIYCGTENQDAEIYFYHLFPFFHLSLQCNTYGNLCQRFLRNYCAEDFEIKYKCWVWLVVLCKRESACCCLSFPLFVHFSFSAVKLSVTEFSAPITARVYSIHLERGQVYCGKETQDSVINICLLFPFFLFFHLSLQCNT